MVKRYLVASIWVYFTLLFGWLAVYLLTGDRFGIVSLANTLAVYYFAPLPLAFAAAWITRRRELWIGALIGLAAFAWLWGPLFIPQPARASADAEEHSTLRVMTYNVLGRQSFTAPMIETIRVEDSDVVFIQELNPALARAFQDELGELYPHQYLDPVQGVTGMGTLSKLPLSFVEQGLPLDWVGEPQVFELDWAGMTVRLVNFHMYPSALASPRAVAMVDRLREDQARALADLVERSELLIAAGDANATSLSTAYRILDAELNDAWREAGFGLGHTFPGSAVPGSSRPEFLGMPVPQWLARIDYILFTPNWQAVSARLARFDGVSDHRGLVAELVLLPE